MEHAQEFRIIVSKECGAYVAQCLEYDICTQAADMNTLKERMTCLIHVELESGLVIDCVPERFHKMWETATSMVGDDSYRLAA